MGKNGTQCCAFGCKKRKKRKILQDDNRSASEGSEDEESQQKRKFPRTFHSLPSDPERKKQWLVNMRMENWNPSAHSRICSDHFAEAHINRTGQRVELRSHAIPTRFKKFPKHLKKKKANINPRSKRATTDPRLLLALHDVPKWRRKRHVQQKPREFNQVAVLTQPQLQPQSELQKQQGPQAEAGSQAQAQPQQEPHTEAGSQAQPKPCKLPPPRKSKIKRRLVKLEASEETQPKAPVAKAFILFPWSIQGDANMFRRRTLSSFFHSHYCLPQSFHWPGDAEANFEPLLPEKSEASTIPHVIKVTERWQWLGLDFRGPLPQTMNGDRFLMTVTDYHSKWVEAFPVAAMVSPEAAGILCDLCAQFGYPLGVLSRLHRTNISKLNSMIRNRLQRQGLEYDRSFIIHHRQTAYLEPVTESLINSMVSGLVKEHPETWNVYLPGAVVRLCCREHPTIGKSPFACMYIKDPRPATTPRDLPFSTDTVEDSSFVIDLSEKPDNSREQTAGSQLMDAVVSE